MPIGKGGRRMLFPWDEPLAKTELAFRLPMHQHSVHCCNRPSCRIGPFQYLTFLSTAAAVRKNAYGFFNREQMGRKSPHV
jgi:hypothetical protein